MSRSEPPSRGTRGPGGGTPTGKGSPPSGATMAPGGGADTTMAMNAAPMGAASTGERTARVALLLSVQAFFEAELLGSRDAREWLEGPHPGPAQWTTYVAGRPVTRDARGRSAP
jgi:hypothetical protein